MYADIQRAWEILGRLNALAPGDFDAVRALLGELTGHELDPSVRVLPAFQTDGGRNLRFGRNVFVNHGCTAMDLGGIDIGDDVMIGPNVHLTSSGHPLDPATRRSQITTAPIRIGRGVHGRASWPKRSSRAARRGPRAGRVLRTRPRGIDARRSLGAPWRRRAPGRALGSAEGVPVAPVGDLASHPRGLGVGEAEMDAGPDAGFDDVVL
jgi:hypothetical protein